MVHGLYICSNLKYSLVGQQFDQLEGCNTNHVISSFSSFVSTKRLNFKKESIGGYYVQHLLQLRSN
jgi:hypothetical protein